jgi:AraC-like DNA-binding protein
MVASRPAAGVELLRAWFAGEAYRRHRHDTYAIGLTDSGVQVFDYRGARRASLPGQVVVLYPDEPHDGRAGTDEGFGYRIVYLDPPVLLEALRALRGRPGPLPFVGEPVSASPALAGAVAAAFDGPPEPLAADRLVLALAEGLLAAGGRPAPAPRRIDARAVEDARRFLEAERTRAVRSAELESVTGLGRFELARQFRAAFGTSPYRYLLRRRLDLARELIHAGRPLAEAALEAGFADQAHLTRAFRSAFGLPPGRYRAVHRAGTTLRAWSGAPAPPAPPAMLPLPTGAPPGRGPG